MARAYVRFVSFLMAIVRTVIGVLLILSVALNLANVVGRYVFHAPIAGAEEVMLFFMVGIVFLGFSRVMWEGKHIKMDIVTNLLPPAFQRASEAIVALSTVVVAFIIVCLALPIIQHLVAFKQVSEAAGVPLAIPQATIPAGFALVILVVVARAIDPERPIERDETPA